ncbi:MAG: alkyl sulfatase dimerization domain-containing protein [Fuerstiella sp.]
MRKPTTTLAVLLCIVPLTATLESSLCADERDATHPPRQTAAKPATESTIAANSRIYTELPFEEKQSFRDARRGFLAKLPNDGIVVDDNNVPVWNVGDYSFIKAGKRAPLTVNPSLWRQAQLLMITGLFEVHDNIHQVRGADLANITFIEGPAGIVVVDPLTCKETATYALQLYYDCVFKGRDRKRVVAVIYTHSHIDHFGGVRGVVPDGDHADLQIIAPTGFLQSGLSENVYVGNAMARRATYTYGNLLPVRSDGRGQVGAGLGLTTPSGTVTLIRPTKEIRRSTSTLTLAGLDFQFLLTPDSEAPAEMFFYIPEFKALCTAEDAVHTLHNVYALRGAKVRNALAWSKYLNQALSRWSGRTDVLFAPHHWPVWRRDTKGNDNGGVVTHLKKQRDMYRYIHDQTLRLANHGYTMGQIAEMIRLPRSLATYWSSRGYYGTVNQNVKAVYQRYLGWFDGNPATLHTLPPEKSAVRYVEFMGGAESVLRKARKSFDNGDYRWVVEVVNHVVFADPNNTAARQLQADALEQLGYQAESGPWRNFYLSGAQELRHGVVTSGAFIGTAPPPDIAKAMPTDMLFDYMGIKLNGPKADGKVFKFNFVFPDDNPGHYLLSLENSALTHTIGHQAQDADATITMTRTTLDEIMLKQITFPGAILEGKITVQPPAEGARKLTEFFLLLDPQFPFWFNVVTPNSPPPETN